MRLLKHKFSVLILNLVLLCVPTITPAAPPSDEHWKKWREDILDSAEDQIVKAVTAKPQDQAFRERLLCQLVAGQLQESEKSTPNYSITFILEDDSEKAVSVYAQDATTAEYYALCKYINNKNKNDKPIKQLKSVAKLN